MIRNVLVGMDGSERSRRGLTWARAVLGAPRLTVLRVIDPIDSISQYESAVSEQRRRQIREWFEQLLESESDPQLATLVREGSAAHEILEAAEETSADLIVITTHGGGAIRRRILGGTTEKLLHSSNVPLLVVPSWMEPQPPRSMRRMLVPLDGSSVAASALPVAVWLAKERDMRMVLATVVQDSEHAGTEAERSQAHLADLAARLGAVVEKTTVRLGDAAPTLAATCDLEHADVVVMAAHGYGAMKRMMLGSVTSKLIRQTKVPVLVGRQDALVKLAMRHGQGDLLKHTTW